MLRQLLTLLIVLLWFQTVSAMTTDLTWQPNAESDLAGYKVYRTSPCGVNGALSLLATLGTTPPSFVDLTAPDADAEYAVTAFDDSGNESAYSNLACKRFVLTYFKSVTDAAGVVWGLVGSGPTYRVYRNGADLCPACEQNNASDVRLNNGVPEFQGTDGDTAWYVYSDATGWQVADSTPPAAPTGLEAK